MANRALIIIIPFLSLSAYFTASQMLAKNDFIIPLQCKLCFSNNKTFALMSLKEKTLGHENLENKKVIDLENPPESIYP